MAAHFILTLSIIVLGYALKRAAIIREEDAGGITRVILNVTLPAVVLKSFMAFRFDPRFLVLPLIMVAYSAVLYAAGLALTRRRPAAEDAPATLFRISLLGFNIGLFAFPLIESLWGSRALGLAAVIDMGNAMVIFGLVYTICLIQRGRAAGRHTGLPWWRIGGDIARRLFTFIPFLCYFVALGLSVAGVQPAPPVAKALDVLAAANGPLVLLLLGITFSLDVTRRDMAAIAKILSIRYALGGAAGIACWYLLPFDHLTRLVLLVCLIMPAGMAIIPYSIEFGYDRRVASAVVNLSNIVSFVILVVIAGLTASGLP